MKIGKVKKTGWVFGLAALLLLGGCGKDAAEQTAGSAQEETGNAAQEELQKETESTKQESGGEKRVVRVVGKASAAPYQFLEEDGTFTGYNGDIFQLISQRLSDKYTFTYETVDADAVFIGLQAGKYDVAVGNYYTSEERNASYEHSNTYTFLSDLRLIVREDDDSITSLEDIARDGKKLAQIDVSDPRYNIIEDYNTEHPDAQVELIGTGFETTGDVLKSVVSGVNDAAIYPLDGYNAVEEEADLPLKTVQTVGIYPVVYYYNRSDENKVLRDEIDEIITELREDGTLSGLSDKWFGFDPFRLEGVDQITDVDFWK